MPQMKVNYHSFDPPLTKFNHFQANESLQGTSTRRQVSRLCQVCTGYTVTFAWIKSPRYLEVPTFKWEGLYLLFSLQRYPLQTWYDSCRWFPPDVCLNYLYWLLNLVRPCSYFVYSLQWPYPPGQLLLVFKQVPPQVPRHNIRSTIFPIWILHY